MPSLSMHARVSRLISVRLCTNRSEDYLLNGLLFLASILLFLKLAGRSTTDSILLRTELAKKWKKPTYAAEKCHIKILRGCVAKHNAIPSAKGGGGRQRGVYLTRDLYQVDQFLGFTAVSCYFILFLRERKLHHGRGEGVEKRGREKDQVSEQG